jgi:hypothetical protein
MFLLQLWDELFCQLFHRPFAREIHYAHGRWQCNLRDCRAQQRHARKHPNPQW